MRVSVLSFDLSDNATGRAELLARLLTPKYTVSVIGPRFGTDVWMPARGGAIEHRAVAARRWPSFIRALPTLLRLVDGDLIYASKPRPTSFGIGLLARLRGRRPLILDIDDWELGFYYRVGFIQRLGRVANLADPNGLAWTWLTDRLVAAADARTVASRFLERRYGGTLIPHVRDTEAWDPSRFDRTAARTALGLGAEPVVMFLGTPRGYKGIDVLVEAVGRLPGVTLAIVGVTPGRSDARRWTALPFTRVFGKIPFDDVPRYLAASDVVAVPQHATPATLGQVPAKLFDAMAMGRPIVSTAVSMIPEILEDCGVVVPPGDVGALTDALRRLLDDPEHAAALGRRARARCEAEYSFTAARARLFPLVEAVAARRTP